MAAEISHIGKKPTLDVDIHHIGNVQAAFLKLNQARFELGQEGVKPSQRFILDILATLLHFNHPMLPGYVSRATPYGIDSFDASGEQLQELKRLTRSFHPSQPVNKQVDILSLFSMGSFGSIAQNSQSDIDLWVCFRPDLDKESLKELDKKCKKISEWAKRHDLEITFFLMNNQVFQHEQKLAFNHEGSGSTQHYLLLDEFYRTFIHWAGQLPAWIFVESSQENNYQSYCKLMQQQRILPEENLVDFGKISTIPADECISSAIWQLYKAISSPYKSIIKLLLLEIYCQKTFEPIVLSNVFKEQLHKVDDKQIIHHWDVDPYLQTYYCIEEYLQSTNQLRRLEFFRRCYYFKLGQPLSHGYETSAKASILHEMTKIWSWDDVYIKNLDDHKDWNIKDTLEERRLIINELNHSYHHIMDFFREQKIKIQASNKELNILGRKLHAAFSRKSGKIEWINPLSSKSLGEKKLIFQKNNMHLWAVLDEHKNLINKKNTLAEMVIWLHCNGILLPETKIFFDKSNLRSELIESLRQIVVKNIPLPIKTAEHSFFESVAFIKKLILFVDYRPKDALKEIPNTKSLMFDCYIDLISINSWNEIICNSKRGGFLEAALEIYISALIKSNDIRQTDIIIHCPDKQKEIKLREDLSIIFKNIYLFFKNNTSGRYIMCIENKYLAIHIHDKNYEIQWIDSDKNLKKYLMTPMFYYCPVAMDDETMLDHPLNIYSSYSCQNSIQVFFKPKNSMAEVTLIDEMGAWHQCIVNYQQGMESMQSLHRFLRVVHDRREDQSSVDIGPLNIFPIIFYEVYGAHDKELQLKKRLVSSRIIDSDISTIYAVVDYKNKDFKFTVYVDEIIISEIDDEALFYKTLANMIAQKNRLGTAYNYYIADIDLSRCRFNLSKSGELHTVHYLKIKKLLEDKINRAVIDQRSLR